MDNEGSFFGTHILMIKSNKHGNHSYNYLELNNRNGLKILNWYKYYMIKFNIETLLRDIQANEQAHGHETALVCSCTAYIIMGKQ